MAPRATRSSSWTTALVVAALVITLLVVGGRTLRHPTSTTQISTTTFVTSTTTPPSTTTSSRPFSSTTTTTTDLLPWAQPLTLAPTASGDLSERIVVIDPGHDGGNEAHPSEINTLVNDGNGFKACDTTGTATNSGYPEHVFAWRVALLLANDLRARGATVVLTRSNDSSIGPCVDVRGESGQLAHADVSISIHADGGPALGHGFAVLVPAGVGPSATMASQAMTFAHDIIPEFVQTGMTTSTYDGQDGLVRRSDLAGLNLSTVPKVLIECGNMRNASDAALQSNPAWQVRAASALAAGIATFLTRS